MDIRKRTDKELAVKVRETYWSSTAKANKDYIGDICDDDIKLAKFIRQCVKDSQKELIASLEYVEKELNQSGLFHGCKEKIKHALRKAMEGE